MTRPTDEQRTAVDETTDVGCDLLAYLLHLNPEAYHLPEVSSLRAPDFGSDAAREVWTAIQTLPKVSESLLRDLRPLLSGQQVWSYAVGLQSRAVFQNAQALAGSLRRLRTVRELAHTARRITEALDAGDLERAAPLLRSLPERLDRGEAGDRLGIVTVDEALDDPGWREAPRGFAWRQDPGSPDEPVEVLYGGTASMLAAAGGGGKSYFGLTLAAHVAGPSLDGIARAHAFGEPEHGGWMLGVQQPGEGRALVILGEDPKGQTMKRLQRVVGVIRGLDGPADAETVREHFNGRLRLAAYDGQAWPVVDDFGQLSANMRRLLGIAKGEALDFIFVDPAARFMREGTESSADVATHFVGAWQRLARETGAHVMVAHHTSQASRNEGRGDATAARGTTALTDGFRSVLTLTPDGDPGDGWITGSTLKMPKTNFARVMPPMRLTTEAAGVPRIETKGARRDRHRREYVQRCAAFVAEVREVDGCRFTLARIHKRGDLPDVQTLAHARGTEGEQEALREALAIVAEVAPKTKTGRR